MTVSAVRLGRFRLPSSQYECEDAAFLTPGSTTLANELVRENTDQVHDDLRRIARLEQARLQQLGAPLQGPRCQHLPCRR